MNYTVSDAVFYLHDTPGALRFEVRGGLAAAVAKALEASIQTALSIQGGRPLVIDLRQASHVEPEADPILSRLTETGARLLVRDEQLPRLARASTRVPEVAQETPPGGLRRWLCRGLAHLRPGYACGFCRSRRAWSL